MQYLLYLLALYALLTLAGYFMTFLQICKITLQYSKYWVETADRVPTYLQELFQIPIQELESFGFKPCCYLEGKSTFKLYPPTNQAILLYNKAHETYAEVNIRRPVEPVNLFDIEFYTLFEDQSVLLTMNGKVHGLIGEIPNYITQDPYTAETSVQWQVHQERLKQLAETKTPCSLTPKAFVEALQTHNRNLLDRLLKVGDISPIDKETELFQFNLLAAVRLAFNIVRGQSKATAIVKQRLEQAKTNSNIRVEIPIELEVEAFKWMEQLQQKPLGNKFRNWLIIASFGLFIASLTNLLPLHALAILIAAVFLHEGGHLLAMKLFGYQDPSVLFLPFLGAVATARKEDATLTQKFWILLAGPLPGLILGIGLAIAAIEGNYPDWIIEAGFILIALNLFNLLPVYPLDGGQIADLLLLSRYAYIGVLFKVFSIIILGWIGLGEPILLLFPILIALTIPNSFRSAKVNAKLRQELRKNPPENRDNLLHLIYLNLRQLEYGNLPFSKRYSLAKDAIHRHHESRAKWTTRVLLVILYFSSLFGGAIGTVQALVPNWTRIVTYSFEQGEIIRKREEAQKREIERATEALRLNPNDVNAYVKRAKARELLQDYRGAIADYDQLVRLNPKDIKLYKRRALIHSRLKDYQSAIADYSAIIKLDSKNIRPYLSRAYMRQQLQDYKGALVDVNYAIQLDPKQPDSYLFRSRIRRNLGDEKGAIADKQKAEALYKAL